MYNVIIHQMRDSIYLEVFHLNFDKFASNTEGHGSLGIWWIIDCVKKRQHQST